jgi:hypothetical protein
MKKIVLALFSLALVLGLGATGAGANGSGQVVFTNSVSGLAGQGAGMFTYGGVLYDHVQIGFSIHCAVQTDSCNGGFYVSPISVSGHGQALTISVSGTLVAVSPGVYTIALASPSAVAGCTLTNSGTPAPVGATPTQSVLVSCSGNGTTTLSGGGRATGIVNVTG